jgi:quercetin dioxygenase-like cupin family protein
MPYLRTGLVIALGLVSAGIALSQQTPAKENRGVVIKPVGVMELADEIEGMAGRQMRMRYITMEPGGEFALHSHKDRPTLEYVLAGTVIEYRDGVAREYKAGDVVVADRNTTHWWQNQGTQQAVFLPVDIFKP